jgi:N,N'-diacetyllegionaminate synthase
MKKNTLFQNVVQRERCIIVAEIGVNHNGSLELARKMIDAAHAAKADAVKFQLFRTEELVTARTEKADYQKVTTGTSARDQWSMLKALELSCDQHRELADYCRAKNTTYICTPYDADSAVFLAEELDVAAIKVASSDTTNIPFLKVLDSLDTPVILSTGMCTMDEVSAAVAAFATTRARRELYLLQCTSEYPAPPGESNLRAMRTMATEFGCPAGFSDHTEGNDVAALAVAHGAVIIEKHFTLDRTWAGPDHRASADAKQFTELVQRVREVEAILGSPNKTITASERANKAAMQKSLYYRRRMYTGETLSPNDLAFKRPAAGLHPSDADVVIGRTLRCDVEIDQLVEVEQLF